MAQQIFISYRRSDSAGLTRALYDRLVAGLPDDDVYLDVETIPGGEDFRESVARALSTADVLLVMIGPEWLSTANAAGRRLDDPQDLVRAEVATALAGKVRVIPVLLDGAPMPRADELPDDLQGLTTRNALEVRPTRFDADATHLIRTLGAGRPERVRWAKLAALLSTAGAVALIVFSRPSVFFYVGVLLLAGCAAFALRRTAVETARLAGRPVSPISATVLPTILMAGLVVSGLTLNREARTGQPFTLVVQATGAAVEGVQGEVALDSRSGSWRAPLGPDGRAVFTRLPAAAEGDLARVTISAAGFEPARTRTPLSSGGVVRVRLERAVVATRVRGTVVDASSRPLQGVLLDFGSGLGTTTTDAQGNYEVVLPLPPGERTTLLATLNGEPGYRDFVVVPEGTALSIRFRSGSP